MLFPCSKCFIPKESDCFHKNKNNKRGFVSTCKQCISDSGKLYYKKNSDRIKKNSKEWSLSNVTKMRAYSRNWCRKNYGTVSSQFKEWRKQNPERSREHVRSRRAKMQAISPELIEARFSMFGNACAYCGLDTCALEADHVIPLSRGGKHIPANIRPACRTCNSSKSARKLSDWLSDPTRLRGRIV